MAINDLLLATEGTGVS